MQTKTIKTNNSFLQLKVGLRIEFLPDKPVIKVLDCCAGKNVIWTSIIKQTRRTIEVDGLDIKENTENNLKLDNNKTVQSLDLSVYDVIDCDVYGSPYKLMKNLFNNPSFDPGRTILFYTYILIMQGQVDRTMLEDIGIPRKMAAAAPTMFRHFADIAFDNFLYHSGYTHKHSIEIDGKKYGAILPKERKQ